MRMSLNLVLACILFVLATFSTSLGLDIPGPPPSPPKPAAAGSRTPVYTGNDPDILNLMDILKRYGFTDDDELKEALRILRPEKFANTRTVRQAGLPDDDGLLGKGTKSNNDNEEQRQNQSSRASHDSSWSSEETEELPPPDAHLENTDDNELQAKGKGLEKLNEKELQIHPTNTHAEIGRQKRGVFGHGYAEEESPVDKVLNTPRTPVEPIL